MYLIKVIVILIVSIVLKINAARILGVFPSPSISHQVIFRPIIQELVKRGHEVVVLTADPIFPKNKSPNNLTEIDVHDLSYNRIKEWSQIKQGAKWGFICQLPMMFRNITSLFETQIQIPEFKKLYDQKFDLLLVEAFIRPTLGLSHVFKAPIIQISSFGADPPIYSAFGAPSHPLMFPSTFAQKIYGLTLLEKVMELCKYSFLQFMFSQSDEFDNEMMRRNFGDDVPNYDELQKNVQMIFLNEHPIWADNHPVPPNILYIGGIHQPPTPEMSKELKAYLDSSKNGVIYVSFGSNAKPSAFPLDSIDVMMTVLSQLPYDVLWKWDKDELPGKSNNIRFAKWFPQPTLLKHPKVKLFISQGGLQSTDEAINAGVPLIGIPLFGDQWYNVEKYVHHKIGLQLDVHALTEDNFKNAIRKVIEDNSFKNNILRLRSLMRDHPIKPLDLAVWWVEHILKFGGEHLKSPAAGLLFFEYYEVPLLLTLAGILMTIVAIIIVSAISILKLLKNCIVKPKNQLKKSKQKSH